MIIYSDVALTFLKEVRAISLKILKFEMNLSFERKRLLYKGYYYPLDFVVFEHPAILGQYIPGKYQIQINKHLIYKTDEQTLQNIIRHEICHYLAHIEFGNEIAPHGREFQAICLRYGYKKDVSSATLELGENLLTTTEDKVFQKITKLFKLASSDNSHEAELATAKANELLRKHHLSANQIQADEQETVLEVVARGKKVGPKHEAIYRILKEFLVAPVFSYQRGSFSLEVIGPRTNVLTAGYVADFLSHTLEEIYLEAKKSNPNLRGVRAKKSFMSGVADGYLSKIKKTSSSNFTSQDLIKCDTQVQEHLQKAYPKLRGRYSKSSGLDKIANALGNRAGENLTINPAVSNKGAKTYLLEK